jgi:multisubunit Na+/H+ antiporter MnhB subunit
MISALSVIDALSVGLLALAMLIVCWPRSEKSAMRRTEVWLAAGFGLLVTVLVGSMLSGSQPQPNVVAMQSEMKVRP